MTPIVVDAFEETTHCTACRLAGGLKNCEVETSPVHTLHLSIVSKTLQVQLFHAPHLIPPRHSHFFSECPTTTSLLFSEKLPGLLNIVRNLFFEQGEATHHEPIVHQVIHGPVEERVFVIFVKIVITIHTASAVSSRPKRTVSRTMPSLASITARRTTILTFHLQSSSLSTRACISAGSFGFVVEKNLSSRRTVAGPKASMVISLAGFGARAPATISRPCLLSGWRFKMAGAGDTMVWLLLLPVAV
ncbi:hypothetical protein M409DRAFT_60032 [Zasmidium cellare ATCC 36951]|uniref:Uncharacterized protein n=1 Tax=Zasmidium cellare ATCC 36951 TaxID=1080233 RepID=A0A6A6BZY3_ZASCE|nr:uncharacterized protein M409DRAFT_60032 [Zasmidium cellare ATCC 36951]KAF2160331.1 hypothetical protein M409DRAFT_60032 [Zasmidium cellare ATCC 36951]